jgi:enoyl-CoA hydratase/carnithine racemase
MPRSFVIWLAEVLDWLETQSSVGAVIFTGRQSNIFLAGADPAELRHLRTHQDITEYLRIPHDIMRRLSLTEKLTVAAINGYCMGGGLEFALACDFRLTAGMQDSAGQCLSYIGMPEVTLGLTPALAGASLLLDLVGRQALPLLYFGNMLTARRALEIGLVDCVVERENLLAQAFAYCDLWMKQASVARSAIKRLTARPHAQLQHALQQAHEEFARCCEVPDKDLFLKRYGKIGARTTFSGSPESGAKETS